MERLRGPWGLVALLLTLLAIAGGVYLSVRRDTTPSQTATVSPEVQRELGSAPPSDLARNPRAAAAYVQRQTCVSNCAATGRMCNATAASLEDQEARTRCDVAREQCEKECR